MIGIKEGNQAVLSNSSRILVLSDKNIPDDAVSSEKFFNDLSLQLNVLFFAGNKPIFFAMGQFVGDDFHLIDTNAANGFEALVQYLDARKADKSLLNGICLSVGQYCEDGDDVTQKISLSPIFH